MQIPEILAATVEILRTNMLLGTLTPTIRIVDVGALSLGEGGQPYRSLLQTGPQPRQSTRRVEYSRKTRKPQKRDELETALGELIESGGRLMAA